MRSLGGRSATILRARRVAGLSSTWPNIQQQKKRVRIAERQRDENLRYRSTVKTLTKRLEAAVGRGRQGQGRRRALELVRTVDKAASRGAMHKNTAARKKAQRGAARRRLRLQTA